jgi:hypothetical protein
MFKTLTYGVGQNKKTFEFKPYTSLHEREVLLSCTLNEFDETGENGINIEKILKSLEKFISPIDTVLSKNEIKVLLFSLRSISLGDEINNKIYCPHCSKVNDSPLNISTIILPNKNTSVDFIELNNIKFYFKDSYSDESDISKLINRCEIRNKEILPKGICSSKTSDKQIIKEIVDNLSLEDYQKLLEFIDDTKVIFNLIYTLVCPHCKGLTRVDMSSEKFIIESLSEDSLVSFYKSVADLVYYGKYSKEDIYGMIPFERNIYFGLLQAQIEEYRQANPK